MTENSSYYTISNVSEKLRIPPHVLRFWEKKFNFVKPKKSQTGRRYYSNQDIVNLEIIKDLLHNKGYTIPGAIKYMKNNSELKDHKSDHLNISNEALINNINKTSDLIFNCKKHSKKILTIYRVIAQLGSASVWGAEGRRFKSC